MQRDAFEQLISVSHARRPSQLNPTEATELVNKYLTRPESVVTLCNVVFESEDFEVCKLYCING